MIVRSSAGPGIADVGGGIWPPRFKRLLRSQGQRSSAEFNTRTITTKEPEHGT